MRVQTKQSCQYIYTFKELKGQVRIHLINGMNSSKQQVKQQRM